MYEKIKCITDGLRPVISEKHDFSASLFKNKEAKEPVFHFATKGSFDFDILKIIVWLLLALCTLSAFSASKKIKKQRKEKIKALKAELRSVKRSAN